MKRHELYVQLISELENNLHHGNPKKMVISMHLEPDGFHIAGIDDRPRTDKEIADIEHSLMMHQRPELASYYGMMVGHDLLGSSRLELIGFQIKGVKVERIPEGGVMINLWIGSEGFDPAMFTIDQEPQGS
ncbi:MAG: hypothetical protein ABFC92_04110 [Rectinema sp.]